MARDDTQWDDDYQYSSRDSDDSPLLYRHERTRPCRERTERRWPVTIIAKFSLFSTAMILFCVLMYIPVYNRANDQMPKVAVAGWSVHTNRDTKVYVHPNNVTSLHEPTNVCVKGERGKLFLLIVVCSSTSNFGRRVAIRETWGNASNYASSAGVFRGVREKYANYNYSYDLGTASDNTERRGRGAVVMATVDGGDADSGVAMPTDKDAERPMDVSAGDVASVTMATDTSRSNTGEGVAVKKRDVASLGRILPELVRALSVTMATGDKTPPQYDNEADSYDYVSNVMRIPPRGELDYDLESAIARIRDSYPNRGASVEFKVVFLLGLPVNGNSSDVQDRIDEEVERYGDVIQEGFIDSYNNLTLKSIMMLKWVTNNCGDSVRYILKTDDDMYINVPNLMMNLQNRSIVYDRSSKEKEYLLIGDLICGARPVMDTTNKWYSPRYMYSGRVYPRYLSGTGYVLSTPTAHALYQAALRTHYFHLEDIYITGMCALRAVPRITPRDEAGFSYNGGGGACAVHSKLTAHRVTPYRMRKVAALLTDVGYVDRCERSRLTQMKSHRESRMYVLYKYLRLIVGGQC